MKKISYNSPVILTFTLVALVALVMNLVTGGASNRALFCIYRTSLMDPLFYVRLFTHVIGHGSVEHFTNNFMIILLAGPLLEEKYGSKRILIMMATCAVVTGLINVIFFPRVALLGASGICFMFILLSSFVIKEENTIPLTLIIAVIFYLGNQVLQGLFVQDNISQMAHLIGGCVGIYFGARYKVKR